MRSIKALLPFLIFLSGILLLFFSVFRGESEIVLLFFIPVIYGAGLFLGIGILLIFFSFFLFFLIPFAGYNSKSEKRQQPHQVERKTRSGGVIFIGPIPIIFGGDESTAKKMMYLGLVIALILAAIYAAYIFS